MEAYAEEDTLNSLLCTPPCFQGGAAPAAPAAAGGGGESAPALRAPQQPRARPSCAAIAVEEAGQLSYDAFVSRYMAPNRPVLIRVRCC